MKRRNQVSKVEVSFEPVFCLQLILQCKMYMFVSFYAPNTKILWHHRMWMSYIIIHLHHSTYIYTYTHIVWRPPCLGLFIKLLLFSNFRSNSHSLPQFPPLFTVGFPGAFPSAPGFALEQKESGFQPLVGGLSTSLAGPPLRLFCFPRN